MTTPAPSPASESPQGGPAVETPKRSKRMILWLVVAPIVVLLLALAGANWKTFHLAYAKHLLASDDHDKQARGAWMVIETHLRVGMSLEEVRACFAPAKVIEGQRISVEDRVHYVAVGDLLWELLFDENDRLLYLGTRKTRWNDFSPNLPPPSK